MSYRPSHQPKLSSRRASHSTFHHYNQDTVDFKYTRPHYRLVVTIIRDTTTRQIRTALPPPLIYSYHHVVAPTHPQSGRRHVYPGGLQIRPLRGHTGTRHGSLQHSRSHGKSDGSHKNNREVGEVGATAERRAYAEQGRDGGGGGISEGDGGGKVGGGKEGGGSRARGGGMAAEAGAGMVPAREVGTRGR